MNRNADLFARAQQLLPGGGAGPEAEGVARRQGDGRGHHPVADGAGAAGVVEIGAEVGGGAARLGRKDGVIALEPTGGTQGAAVVLACPAQAREQGDILEAFTEVSQGGLRGGLGALRQLGAGTGIGLGAAGGRSAQGQHAQTERKDE